MAYRLIDARFDVTNPAAEVASPGSQAYAKLLQYTLDGLGNRSQVQTTPPTPPTAVTYATDVVNQYLDRLGGKWVGDVPGGRQPRTYISGVDGRSAPDVMAYYGAKPIGHTPGALKQVAGWPIPRYKRAASGEYHSMMHRHLGASGNRVGD